MLEYEINQLEIPFLDLFLDLHQKGDGSDVIPNSFIIGLFNSCDGRIQTYGLKNMSLLFFH